jgi:hypothetical protein
LPIKDPRPCTAVHANGTRPQCHTQIRSRVASQPTHCGRLRERDQGRRGSAAEQTARWSPLLLPFLWWEATGYSPTHAAVPSDTASHDLRDAVVVVPFCINAMQCALASQISIGVSITVRKFRMAVDIRNCLVTVPISSLETV